MSPTSAPTPTKSAPAVDPRPQAPTENRWRLDTFRSLRHPNYRLYFTGQLISVLGSWVQTTALTWLAWERTHESKWTALIPVGNLLTGWAADRWGEDRTLLVEGGAIVVVAALLVVVAACGLAVKER